MKRIGLVLLVACGGGNGVDPSGDTRAGDMDMGLGDAVVSGDAAGDGAIGSDDEFDLIPASAAGDQLRWLIAVLNEGGGVVTASDAAAHFSSGFLAAVSAGDLSAFLESLSTDGAPFTLEGFDGAPTEYSLVAELRDSAGALWLVSLAVETTPPNLIGSLFVSPGPRSWAELDADITGVASTASMMAAEIVNGSCQTIHANAPNTDYALGSGFKLYILYALSQQSQAGTVSWDDTLPITDAWKSLPSGDLHLETAGTEFTLREYAHKMISISDNTGTDHLLYHLGRTTVESFLSLTGHTDPSSNIPFLATNELFRFKGVLSDTEIGNYLALDSNGRRNYLDTVLPGVDLAGFSIWTQPSYIDTLEWFGSATDMCNVMAALRDEGSEVMDTLTINPGIDFGASDWPTIAFKGGSEPGVLTFTWLLERDDGRWFFLSFGFNDPQSAVDEGDAALLAVGAAQTLYAEP